ncbi:hypothetical protein [Methylobacterium platani]
MLALVLALSLVAPESGEAADLAFHAGSRGQATGQGIVTGPGIVTGKMIVTGPEAVVASAAAHDAGAADPGLACHLHCGCHQAAPLAAASADPACDGAPPLYARLTEAVSSLAPDRLPRPPRA